MSTTQDTNTATPLAALSAQGVSIWLDDLNRSMIQDGDLAALIKDKHVVGVTTNPTIFAAALAEGEAYNDQVQELARRGADVDEAVFALTTRDVRDACDVLRPVYERTEGLDGRVSIEVDPGMASATADTEDMAERLWKEVDRPNLFIKIPATQEGLAAITATIARGISVNVTLIFSLDRYRQVMDAYLTGLEQARAQQVDISDVQSVASFFVSRVDSEVDSQLTEIGTEQALGLRGMVAVANARLAYQAFKETFSTARWYDLAEAGANVQRPLWASTGVKNEGYPDTMYVVDLVAPDTVNTMPAQTLDAVADHGTITTDTVTGNYKHAQRVLDEVEQVGVSYAQVVALLEEEGVQKFVQSWDELLETVQAQRDQQSTSA